MKQLREKKCTDFLTKRIVRWSSIEIEKERLGQSYTFGNGLGKKWLNACKQMIAYEI